MSYVIAIDVGIKNLGLCIFDFRTSTVVEWDNVTLVPSGRYIPAQNVQNVRTFIHKYKHFFDNAFQVVVERQMRCNMRIIESVIQALYFDICIIISPRAVKMHYNLSTKNYRANKQRAVDWAKLFVLHNTDVFQDGLKQFRDAEKQDDLADALILLLYYLDTYSNQLTASILDPFTDVELQG